MKLSQSLKISLKNQEFIKTLKIKENISILVEINDNEKETKPAKNKIDCEAIKNLILNRQRKEGSLQKTGNYCNTNGI